MALVSFRRSLAALILAANGLMWLVNALLGPPELLFLTSAMTLVYATGYFAVSSDWFWGRWYGIGLCYFGSLYLLGILQNPEYTTFFALLGGSHLLALASLYGSTMASHYEGAPEWRLTFNIDEDSARRLGRSVQSAATTLPILILQLLGPRTETWFVVVLGVGLGVVGLVGLVRLKTWSLLALAAAGAALMSTAGLPSGALPLGQGLGPLYLSVGVAGLLLPLAIWAGPIARALRAR